ncbi:MAG: CRISPR-associated helicase Cas3' [Candidatus Omnitrophica bacterium]|nr:CRISPR-associated helicase Cas3' [Candidatus Omnitrophota bacterium]
MNKPPAYVAHVQKESDGESWRLHDLEDHLRCVAERAKEFAASFNSGDWAELAGLWHDLGKFLKDWQAYLCKKTGYDEDAHIEGYGGRPNHSSAGAVLSLEKFRGSPAGRLLAYVIAGHHAGLPDWAPDEAGGDLQNRLFDTISHKIKAGELDEIRQIAQTMAYLSASMPKTFPLGCSSPPEAVKSAEYLHLWIRMLFSCLVDADFLDTEEFMTPENAKKRGIYSGLQEFSSRFDKYMEQKEKNAAPAAINKARAEILKICRAKAKLTPGFFSLTVPTGGGKTLSSMAFALEHALKYGKQRIIMAIPYTSIIEQAAAVYREVFGEEAVLEHHSNLDPDKEDHKSRLASENWDMPIVVTTNVQLFESLFSGRTSVCRKLHNIVNSVIILDEAQMLAPEYLKPVLSVLRGLVKHFGVTVIFCTATQPALSAKIGSGLAVFEGLPPATEIIDTPEKYFEELKRVEITLPNISACSEWRTVADDLKNYKQALCVVNTRKDCRDLHKLMPEGTIHLSANMCGEERSEIIAVIKKKLDGGDSIRVISTQLVEAGVDIDFPVVYRALAGIDSIAQAAGRCNREGRLNDEGRLGKVVVFVPPKKAPVGLLRKGEDAARSILGDQAMLEMTPELFKEYFKSFYGAVNDFDKPKFIERLVQGVPECAFQFRTFAQDFKLIDDTAQRGIIVWYEGKTRNSLELIGLLRRNGPEPWLLRKLQRFIVNVPLPVFNKLAQGDYIEDLHGYWVQKATGLYKSGVGLLPDSADWDRETFIF